MEEFNTYTARETGFQFSNRSLPQRLHVTNSTVRTNSIQVRRHTEVPPALIESVAPAPDLPPSREPLTPVHVVTFRLNNNGSRRFEMSSTEDGFAGCNGLSFHRDRPSRTAPRRGLTPESLRIGLLPARGCTPRHAPTSIDGEPKDAGPKKSNTACRASSPAA